MNRSGWTFRLLRWWQRPSPRRAMRRFRLAERQLQTSFLTLAQQTGKPRGLRWADCQWLRNWVLLHDTDTRMLTLLVELHVSFEAIPGEGMEDLAAVTMLRQSTAVFHYQAGRWGTGGRVLFNLTPEMAAQRMQDACERIAAGSE